MCACASADRPAHLSIDIRMLPASTISALARQLYDARKTRTQLRHFSKAHPEMTVEDGYAIQREWVRLEIADGRRVRGRKIGLTSRAMQQASQIDEPDYAPLMDDMFFEQGGDIPFDRFIAPRVEVELAFVLGKPLKGPGVNAVRRAVGHRVRDAGGRDHRRAHRAVRPRDQGDAQGLRHDLRLRGQRRHRDSAAARCGRPTSTCAGSARCCTRTA